MFYLLILISGLKMNGIEANMSSTFHDINVFNCTIKVSNKYKLYVNSDLRFRYALPLDFGTGGFSFLPRDGFVEKRIRGARIIKNESNSGLDYTLIEVNKSMNSIVKFAIIRDANIEMFVSGDAVSDMKHVYEECVVERKGRN